MKAQVYVNRHIVAANKKATRETGVEVDNPALSISTYRGTLYAKQIEFTAGCKLIQDAANARCSGATIWIECQFESLVIDGVKASALMFKKTGELKNRTTSKKSTSKQLTNRMLYIVDNIETRTFSENETTKKKRYPRVYFFEKK